MVIALILMVIAGYVGWRRAARRKGGTADRLQYAAAHGIPAFLIGMVVMTLARNYGLLP